MSTRVAGPQGPTIESRDELVAYLEAGNKPMADWRIGTEHEKFVYDLKSRKPVPYEGRPGIRALLEGMQRFGWSPVMEGEHIIGLTGKDGAISLEPGGHVALVSAGGGRDPVGALRRAVRMVVE